MTKPRKSKTRRLIKKLGTKTVFRNMSVKTGNLSFEAPISELLDEDETIETKSKTISAVLTRKNVRSYGFEDMAL